MSTNEATTPRNAVNVTIIDAPIISPSPDDKAGDILLNFFRALGWNGEDNLDPTKVRTTKEVFYGLRTQMSELCPDPVSVGMLMVNIGPGTEEHISAGKVYLYEGWVTPVTEKGETDE